MADHPIVPMTIAQLADRYDLRIEDVRKAARETRVHPRATDANFELRPHMALKILRRLEIPIDSDHASDPGDDEPDEAGVGLPEVRPEATATASWNYRPMKRAMWLHPDVEDCLRKTDLPRQRLSIVLQHLTAHGRTTTVKGCRDEANRGWRRSPLGGHGGMQYYLWWAPSGSPQTRCLDVPANGMVVRAVRHHDIHHPLSAGKLDDYIPISQRETLGDGIGASPWTEEQCRFVDAPDGVRVVLGRPGSGKTTVLWTAVEAHPGESVLYLTWSDQLRTLSAERFEAYAPANTDVRAKTFYDLLGEIAGRDVEVRPHAALVADFGAAIHKITDKDLGPWKGRTEAMFAEMRAHLVGAATGAATSAPHTKDPSPWRLSEDAYHRARDPHIGHAAARAVLNAYRVLARNGLCERLFPEMVAAATAVKRLQSGTIPDGYEAFDRVVVDEVQDLTACEVAALLEYCRALAIRQGRAPRLLIAGDSGQTVRPTGFDWGTLNGLISERIADPVRYDLRRSLRCPEPIARVIARADALYKDLERELHPDKQLQYIDHGPDEDEQVGAAPFGRPTLVYLTIKDQEEAELLLDALGSRDDLQDQVMVVAAAGAHPTWLASRHRDLVLLPAAAKGLECETVIVIEPAPILEHVQVRPDLDPDERLEDRQRRMAVDRLRVAASRATQTLVFADVAPDATTTARSMDLMPEAQPMDVPELLALLTDAEMPTVERVDARISEASRLFGEMPGRAWLRARQALQLLRGDSASAHDEDSALSARACSTVLRFAAALLLGGPPEGVGRNELIRGAREALQTPAFRDGDDAFEALGAWSLDQSKPPFALLSAAQGYLPRSQSAWFRDALASRRQMLRAAIGEAATQPDTAAMLTDDVEGWLQVTDYAGDAPKKARELRSTAFDTLLASGRTESAEEMLAAIRPLDQLRKARLREQQGQHELAAKLFEREGRVQDALRNWRQAGEWDEALRLADNPVMQADLRWLHDVNQTMQRRPQGIRGRLTPAEEARLAAVVRPCLGSSGDEQEYADDKPGKSPHRTPR